ncbi:MAG: hypothetical protein RTU30_00225 [Candidatus Thorarchaeota archaeon]
MSDEQIDDAYVRRFGFRKFSGIRGNKLYRIMALGWFNLIETIRRSGFTKFLLVLMFINLLIQDAIMVLIVSILPPEFMPITINEYFTGVYAESVLGMVSVLNRIGDPNLGFFSFISVLSGGTSVMWILLLAIMGGGLISDDRLHRTTEAYFSRISRYEYLLGKLLSLILFSTIVVTLPAFLQYFLLTWSLNIDFFLHIGMLFWAIGFTFFAVIIVSVLTLAISSLTTRRTVATMTLLILVIMTSALPSALGLLSNPDTAFLLVDFVGMIAMLGAITLGYSSVDINFRSVGFYNGVGLEAQMVVVTVFLTLLISVLILFNVLIRRDN